MTPNSTSSSSSLSSNHLLLLCSCSFTTFTHIFFFSVSCSSLTCRLYSLYCAVQSGGAQNGSRLTNQLPASRQIQVLWSDRQTGPDPLPVFLTADQKEKMGQASIRLSLITQQCLNKATSAQSPIRLLLFKLLHLLLSQCFILLCITFAQSSMKILSNLEMNIMCTPLKCSFQMI